MPLAVTFPLSGRFRDLHPLEYVRAERTKKKDTAVLQNSRILFVMKEDDMDKFRQYVTANC